MQRRVVFRLQIEIKSVDVEPRIKKSLFELIGGEREIDNNVALIFVSCELLHQCRFANAPRSLNHQGLFASRFLLPCQKLRITFSPIHLYLVFCTFLKFHPSRLYTFLRFNNQEFLTFLRFQQELVKKSLRRNDILGFHGCHDLRKYRSANRII